MVKWQKLREVKAAGAKSGPQQLYLKRKARQYQGCEEAMTLKAISSTYKFFQDNSLELLKDGSPRKQEFNPIYFFRVLKRSLINLHVLLTKCPKSPSCALESCGGTNNSQSSEKLASKKGFGDWRNETQNLWHKPWRTLEGVLFTFTLRN